MSAEILIETILNDAVIALNLPHPVAFENTQIDWNLQVPFIRLYNQPTLKEQAACGETARNFHKGIFHIEVCYPGNAGVIKPKEIAALITPSFKRGKHLVSGTDEIICEKCSIQTAYVENSWYILPIFVFYYTFLEN